MLTDDGRAEVSILVVEDDVKLSELVGEYLEKEGFQVSIEGRGDTAAQRIVATQPDLVVLDIMLPGIDGFEVCRRVRPRYHKPILMLTAKGDLIDEILGLEIGADDYLSKPVKPRLLLTRIRALLRRSSGSNGNQADTPSDTVSVAGLVLDRPNRGATVGDSPIDLTTAEFDLLWFLATRAGQVVTRDQIYEAVKGIEYDGVDRSIDLRIARLRKKLGDDARHPRRIKSIRGSGYLMARR